MKVASEQMATAAVTQARTNQRSSILTEMSTAAASVEACQHMLLLLKPYSMGRTGTDRQLRVKHTCIRRRTTSRGYATVCPVVPAKPPHASRVSVLSSLSSFSSAHTVSL